VNPLVYVMPVQVAQLLEHLTAVLATHVQHHATLRKLYDRLFSRLSLRLRSSVSPSNEAAQIAQQLTPLLYPWRSGQQCSSVYGSIEHVCAHHGGLEACALALCHCACGPLA
jgi:hypothetical protein